MSLNLNKVILCGHLTADPELKQTPSGVSVTSFTLAVNRRYSGKDEQPTADFISVVAWRQTAEFITRYFNKGSALCVVGSIQTRTWQDQNDGKHYATEVVAEEALFAGVKEDQPAEQTERQAQPQAQPAGEQMQMRTAPRFEELKPEEDIPF